MDGRFEVRRAELLAQARVSVEGWDVATQRLETFVEPFVESLIDSAQRRHFVEYASGLLSNLERKTREGIAYLHDQDRKPMQQFVGGGRAAMERAVGQGRQLPGGDLYGVCVASRTRLGQSDGTLKHDYYLSNANPTTPLGDCRLNCLTPTPTAWARRGITTYIRVHADGVAVIDLQIDIRASPFDVTRSVSEGSRTR